MEENMTKSDMIDAVAKRTQLPKHDIGEVLDFFFQAVRASIYKGEEIEIRDFACFRIQERSGYIGRNPQTGEPVQVPAKKVVKIIPSRHLVVKE
jgi:nucleoid DNA-binding protein